MGTPQQLGTGFVAILIKYVPSEYAQVEGTREISHWCGFAEG
jgi:hypothetical protein